MRFVQRLPGALLGLILLAAVLLGVPLAGAGPASAHDAVESTSPSNGATVPAVPEAVSLTLTNRPLALGSQIKVSDAAGTNWADGAVQILDNVASQRLKAGAPAGLFTVQWRLASSDGHPIEGTFSFTATAGTSSTAGTGSPAAPASGAASATASVPTMGTAAPGTTTAPSPVAGASQPFPWSIVIFVAVAVGILVALALMAKRRLDAGDGDGDSAP